MRTSSEDIVACCRFTRRLIPVLIKCHCGRIIMLCTMIIIVLLEGVLTITTISSWKAAMPSSINCSTCMK